MLRARGRGDARGALGRRARGRVRAWCFLWQGLCVAFEVESLAPPRRRPAKAGCRGAAAADAETDDDADDAADDDAGDVDDAGDAGAAAAAERQGRADGGGSDNDSALPAAAPYAPRSRRARALLSGDEAEPPPSLSRLARLSRRYAAVLARARPRRSR